MSTPLQTIKTCSTQYRSVLFFFFFTFLLYIPLQAHAQDGCAPTGSLLRTLGSAAVGNNPMAAQTQTQAAITATICQPIPRIKIPGLQFTSAETLAANTYTDPQDGSTYLFIPFLGEYISAVYRYGIALAGFVAVLILIVSGIQWIMGGASPDNIDAAKERIKNALTGLLIIATTYTFLYIINPELTSFKSLKIELVRGGGDTGGDTDLFDGQQEPGHYQCTTFTPRPDLRGGALSDAQALGFYCPGSGGPSEIARIVESMEGKVVYRYGGKGGEPPYSEKAEWETGPLNCSCPPGTICLDCSGFVSFVYKCAGLGDINSGTNRIFGDDAVTPKLIKSDVLSENYTVPGTNITVNIPVIDGEPVYPGDLFGWRGGNPGDAGLIGHVLIYIGNGNLAEARGGGASTSGGRYPGHNPRITKLVDYNFPGDGDETFFRLYKVTNNMGNSTTTTLEERIQWVTN